MQLQGGACAYNLSASCKNSSARSQAKEYPKQLVATSPLCLPFRTVFLLPSEKFTMTSRMYVVKRGKPAASEALCARGSFFGGACRHAPTSHVQLLSLSAFFRYRWAKRDGHVRQDHLQDQQTLLWTEPGFRRPSRFSFWLKKAQIVFNSAWHLRCFSVVVIVFAFPLSIGRDHYEGDIRCVWWGHYH